jgi:hypothetical protein
MRERGRISLVVVWIAALLIADAERAIAQNVITPPPVSGRRLSDPSSISSADVLARIELIRGNVESLRVFMGKRPAPAPLLRVQNAQPPEVSSQIRNLERHANQLVFEQVRTVRDKADVIDGIATRADVFGIADEALRAILIVKQNLGIETVIPEKLQPESTTVSEVFNATVVAGNEINQLLDKRVSSSDVFQLVTAAVYSAATLHSIIPAGPSLPIEPSFEPNKAPADAYARMYRCYELIREVAATAAGMDMLRFEFDPSQGAMVLPSDEEDLAALLVEHLNALHRAFPEAKPASPAYYAGRRFAAHVYQRAGLLEQILTELVAASRDGRLSPRRAE